MSIAHPSKHGMKLALIGIAVNAVLAVVKTVAGILGHSQALIADGIESATDVVSSLVVWGGLRVSAQPPDLDHPFGHGKAEPMATVVVSVALFVAALLIARESIHQILIPHQTPAAFTLIVLVAVIIVKESLSRFVLKGGTHLGSSAVVGDAWHHRSDAITSAAALIGIIIALIGGKGWESADDWAALLASGIILYSAFLVIRPAVRELMDQAPDPAVEEEIRLVASGVEGVIGLHRCYVRKMGFEYFVNLDVIVDRNIPVYEGHEIAHRVQDAVRASNQRVQRVFVHIEPDAK